MKIKYLTALLCVSAVIMFGSCKSTKAAAEPEQEASPAVAEETQVTEPAKVEEAKPVSENSTEKADIARKAAVEAGAEKYYPELFKATDKKYSDLCENIKKDPKKDYSSEINDVAKRFTALAKASLAKTMKAKADELGLAEYDKASYEKGEKLLADFDAIGADASSEDYNSKASAAFDSFLSVIQKGFVALAGKERNAALEAKKQADSVKAGVAKKDEYKAASDTFKKADSDYVTKDIENAYKGYKSAKESYAQLFDTVSKNRAAALAAIERAKQAVSEAESYSAEADSIAPLKEQVAGIEAEDAVLLETDSLANPDEAIINVEEGDTAKKAAEQSEKEGNE